MTEVYRHVCRFLELSYENTNSPPPPLPLGRVKNNNIIINNSERVQRCSWNNSLL